MLVTTVCSWHPFFTDCTLAHGLDLDHNVNPSCNIGLGGTCLLPDNGGIGFLFLESRGISDMSAHEGR